MHDIVRLIHDIVRLNCGKNGKNEKMKISQNLDKPATICVNVLLS